MDKYDLRDKLVLKFISRNLSWGMLMLYMIVDFVGSTAYSSIIESDPLPVDQMRPYILDAVQAIMKSQEVPENSAAE